MCVCWCKHLQNILTRISKSVKLGSLKLALKLGNFDLAGSNDHPGVGREKLIKAPQLTGVAAQLKVAFCLGVGSIRKAGSQL